MPDEVLKPRAGYMVEEFTRKAEVDVSNKLRLTITIEQHLFIACSKIKLQTPLTLSCDIYYIERVGLVDVRLPGWDANGNTRHAKGRCVPRHLFKNSKFEGEVCLCTATKNSTTT